MTVNTPKHWHNDAHQHWLQGDKHQAIQAVIQQLNLHKIKPIELTLQAAYYLFFIQDYAAAARILETNPGNNSENIEACVNLAVCYAKLRRFEEAAICARRVTELDPSNYLAYDIQAAAFSRLRQFSKARHAGTQALILKDQLSTNSNEQPKLPDVNTLRNQIQKPSVIAYSLWGKNPRYLRGALRNALLAADIYPGWTLRFYVDDSVPADFIGILKKLGAQTRECKDSGNTREKLCRRFAVASDPGVGYFLVRDADSVISPREATAVKQWQDSGKCFHVIRDWWSHTDLVLAGLWGGIATALPDIDAMLEDYQPPHVETLHIDQWFLRDCVWQYIRQSHLLHDRFFETADAVKLAELGEANSYHIGQDEFTARSKQQTTFLAPWISLYPCLQIPQSQRGN